MNKHQNPYIHHKSKPSHTLISVDAGDSGAPESAQGAAGESPTEVPVKPAVDSSSHVETSEEAKPKIRTQTSLNARVESKSALSMNAQIKSKGSGFFFKNQPTAPVTRNAKNTITNVKSLNSPTSVKSHKVTNSLMTDRSERSALAKKHEKLTALLLDKKTPVESATAHISERKTLNLLNERESRGNPRKDKDSRSSHSNQFNYKDRDKFTNKYLWMGKKQPSKTESQVAIEGGKPTETADKAEKSPKKVETRYAEISFNNVDARGERAASKSDNGPRQPASRQDKSSSYKPISPLQSNENCSVRKIPSGELTAALYHKTE